MKLNAIDAVKIARIHLVKAQPIPTAVQKALAEAGIKVRDIEVYDNTEELMQND